MISFASLSNRAPVARVLEGLPPSCHTHVTGIHIHCVAGLGRAPVLVGIALVEVTFVHIGGSFSFFLLIYLCIQSGMDAQSAITTIREKRRNAFNMKQLAFLKSYQPRKKGKCVLM